MASMNGVLSPPPQQLNDNLSLSAKRKREDDTIEAQPKINGRTTSPNNNLSDADIQSNRLLVRDLLDVLKRLVAATPVPLFIIKLLSNHY